MEPPAAWWLSVLKDSHSNDSLPEMGRKGRKDHPQLRVRNPEAHGRQAECEPQAALGTGGRFLPPPWPGSAWVEFSAPFRAPLKSPHLLPGQHGGILGLASPPTRLHWEDGRGVAHGLDKARPRSSWDPSVSGL